MSLSSKPTVLRRLQTFYASAAASDNERRSIGRYRRAGLTAAASIGAKVAGILAQVISVRLAIHHLGLERYGVWLTLSSLIGLLGFADLGLGNGLLNAVAAADGRSDTHSANTYISNAFFMLSGVALTLLVLFGSSYTFVPWPTLFNVHTSIATGQVGAACAAFAVCFAVNLPLSVAQRVVTAYQKGYINSLWQIIGNLLALLAVVIAAALNAGLPLFVFAFMGGPLASQGFNTLHTFFFTSKAIRPQLRQTNRATIVMLLHTGLAFVVVQVLATTALASDNVILARVLGAGAVTPYGVVFLLFNTAAAFTMMCLMPFWSAYGEANARGDIAWIRNALRRTSAIAFVFSTIAGIILILFGRQIIGLWVGNQFRPSTALLITSAISSIVVTSTHPMGIYLFGTGRLRFSIISSAALLPVAIISKFTLLRIMGSAGLPLGTALPYLFTVSVPAFLYTKRLIKR